MLRLVSWKLCNEGAGKDSPFSTIIFFQDLDIWIVAETLFASRGHVGRLPS